MIEVRTQAQLEKALKKTNNGADELIVCLGGGHFTLWGNSTATLRGNSTATLWENSTATLWENSTATLWENSTGRLDAQPHSHVRRHPASTAKIFGGVILEMFVPKTAAEWCEYYGVEIRKGGNLSRKLAGEDVAILFKALPNDLSAYGGFQYVLGEAPVAPDWDGGKRECGGGLHFSPTPRHAEEFGGKGRYLACPVLLSEICVHPDGMYPQKVKAPGCCAPVWEVDVDGKLIEVAEEVAS